MPHPDEGLIHAWLDGELDGAEAARVEALVASDADWAAAAAEARGLMAASSRIVGALDHVPARVIPKERPAPRASRWWVARVAALLVIVTGTALVLRETGPEQAQFVVARKSSSPEVLASVTPSETTAVRAPAPSALATPRIRKPLKLDSGKAAVAAAAPREAKAQAEVVQNAPAPAAAPAAKALKAEPVARAPTPTSVSATGARNFAAGVSGAAGLVVQDRLTDRADARDARAEKVVAPRPAVDVRCYEVRRPTSSVRRTLILDSAQAADSVRLGRITLTGDTLRSATGELLAVRIPCQVP